jgi:hypothetical protein
MRSNSHNSRCSFCGKSQSEVKKLIVVPATGICDECIESCMLVLIDDGFYSEQGIERKGKRKIANAVTKMASGRKKKAASTRTPSKAFAMTAELTKTSYSIPSQPGKDWLKFFLEKWKAKIKGKVPKPEIRIDGNTIILLTVGSDMRQYERVIEECIEQANKLTGINIDVENCQTNEYVN